MTSSCTSGIFGFSQKSALAQKIAAKAYFCFFFAGPRFCQEAVSGARTPKFGHVFVFAFNWKLEKPSAIGHISGDNLLDPSDVDVVLSCISGSMFLQFGGVLWLPPGPCDL